MVRKIHTNVWKKSARKIEPQSLRTVDKDIENGFEEIITPNTQHQNDEAVEKNYQKKQEDNVALNSFASFKIIIVEWFLSSTAHALPNIFRTSNIILKIVWLCCFLASGSYCMYSIIKSLSDFLTYPTTISTTIVQEIPTPFPAITICNLKTVKSSVLRNNKHIPLFSPLQFNDLFEYIISQIYIIRTGVSDNSNSAETRRAMGYELNEMLISCMFNYKNCKASDFNYHYDPLYGNCFTFNKGVYENGTVNNIQNVSTPGPLYGLILELFLGDPKTETYLEYYDGVVISIHNQSTVPFSEGDKIMAATGASTDIIISRNFVSKLDYPYGDCLKDTTKSSSFSSDIFDYIVKKLEVDYSHNYCYSLCMQKETINRCNCSNTFLPAFDQPIYCGDFLKADCVKDVIYRFGELPAGEDCKKACPFECDSIEYLTTSYKAYYPTDYYKDVLYNYSKHIIGNTSYDDLSRAVAKVSIYYKNMHYTMIKESPSTNTEAFFSNIGGTLGLYLGISVLSTVEVFELAFNLILALIIHKKQKK